MPRLSVCVEMIFRHLPFIERLEATSKSGYDAFEFWQWQDKDIGAIAAEASRLRLKVAAFGVGPNIVQGTLVDSSNHDAYLATMRMAIEHARRLDCQTLIVTTGNEIAGLSRAAHFDALQRGLERVAHAAAEGGVTMVVEPLNTRVDHAGYFLDHGADAFRIVREIGHPNLRVLYDIYHMQIMDGDLISTIESNIDLIGHFHVADVPGRHEPGTGEINYANVFRRIDATSYAGHVGLEYRPSGDHAASLAGVKALA